VIRLALVLAAGGEPLIRVGPVALDAAAISRRAAALRAEGRKFTGDQFVDALIDESVLAAEARRTGLDKDPSVQAEVEQNAAQVLAAAFVDGPLASSFSPSDADLEQLYHQDADVVQLDLVVVATETEAKQVKDRLAAGGEFALEAARSLDPGSARNKGSTGPLRRADLPPALAKPAFEAPLGDLFGPIQLPMGFAVGRVVRRELADPKGFAARRPALESFARKQWSTRAKKHLAEELRAKASASVDEAFLKGLAARVDATPAELDHPFATVSGKPIPYRILLPRVRRLGTGHLQGPGTKIQLAWTAVDERVLAGAARERGLASRPEVQLDVASARDLAHAAAMADRIRSQQPAKASAADRERAVTERIAELRKDIKVEVDRKAAAAAAEAPR
jgi:hypothetical protein